MAASPDSVPPPGLAQKATPSLAPTRELAKYSINYRGGHPAYPRSKGGGIGFRVTDSGFELTPTSGSRSWFQRALDPLRAGARIRRRRSGRQHV